jgi:hypothetical protein
MRRIGTVGSVSIVLLLVASLALAGCDVPFSGTDETPTPTAATPAATTGAEGSGAFAVGDSLAAVWTDGALYLATVTAVDGANVTVTYADDGSSGTVAAADCRPISDTAFTVGDRVLAVWASGRFYPGEVSAVEGTTYTVTWDDGSDPSQVEAGKIIAE